MKSSDFEKKIEKAKEILNSLMNPEITLSEGMKKYKEGMKALKEASLLLEKAKLEFEELKSKDSND